MRELSFILQDEQDTLVLGGLLGKLLFGKPYLLFLRGNLGAGKTTLVRGLLRAIGFQGSTKSPTYTLVEPYQIDSQSIYHFDLYRLSDPGELEFLGVDEYLTENNALCIIEWPENGEGWLPTQDVEVTLEYDESGGRKANILASELIIAELMKQPTDLTFINQDKIEP